MRPIVLVTCVLAGCFDNPAVEVDRPSLDMPRGTSEAVLVLIDGAAVDDLFAVSWSVDDPAIATVTPEWDGKRLRIDAALEGETTLRVGSHGQIHYIPVRVGPPAIRYLWIEPSTVEASVGTEVQVKATGLDTMYQLQDLTHASDWTVRDQSVASLDMAGMMLRATGEGHTTLHANFAGLATITDITISK
jgi:hypothetical protein